MLLIRLCAGEAIEGLLNGLRIRLWFPISETIWDTRVRKIRTWKHDSSAASLVANSQEEKMDLCEDYQQCFRRIRKEAYLFWGTI